jgi:hypothetical protein
MVVAEGASGDSADGGKDAVGDGNHKDADTGPTCTIGASPAENGCITNESGVFVSTTGNDEMGMGTMTSPFATITHALTKILGSTKSIFVCEGAYADQITVSVPVNIYGGLTCASGTWTYSASAVPVVTGSAPNFAIEVNSVSGIVDIEDMNFSGMAGTSSSPSSIAAFVIGSPTVTMKRTALAADAGADGSSGAAGVTGTPTPAVLTGSDADASAPGAECSITCSTGGVSTGGSGGTVATSGDGVAGTVAQSMSVPVTATGAGGTTAECTATNTGGANGSAAYPATAADGMGATVGTLDSLGWHPGSGQTGTNGSPGQGGGGGGSVAGWGGGGACGGCGGSGGGFGTGGGASIALLAFNSAVQLQSCKLTTSTAGNGGGGAGGGAGQPGGTKGNGSGAGCSGGNGGTGSAGGAGGGGAGGVSIGVLYGGTGVPTADTKTSIVPGTAGMLGTGGDPGKNDGSAGVSSMLEDVTAL